MKQHTIITISRQYGSGGRRIGHLVAERLEIIEHAYHKLTEEAKSK